MWSTVPASASDSQAQILRLQIRFSLLSLRCCYCGCKKITKSCNNSTGKRQFRKLFEKPFKIKLNNEKEKGNEKGSETSSGSWERKQLELLLFLLLLLLLVSMYFNIKFCCTHNFLPYLRFVICVCGFYCGALRFASVGGSGNCWYDREMCVHVYVFSLLHVACGM